MLFKYTAKNYIRALEFIVQGTELTNDEFVSILCHNMRQSTASILRKLYVDDCCEA